MDEQKLSEIAWQALRLHRAQSGHFPVDSPKNIPPWEIITLQTRASIGAMVRAIMRELHAQQQAEMTIVEEQCARLREQCIAMVEKTRECPFCILTIEMAYKEPFVAHQQRCPLF